MSGGSKLVLQRDSWPGRRFDICHDPGKGGAVGVGWYYIGMRYTGKPHLEEEPFLPLQFAKGKRNFILKGHRNRQNEKGSN